MKKLNLFEPLTGFSKANLYYNLWNRACFLWEDRKGRIKNTLAEISDLGQKIKFLSDICKMKSLNWEWQKNEKMLSYDDTQFNKVKRYF